MNQELRFATLVKDYGKPETLTLWTKPAANRSLMKAIKDNRVMTVFQTPKGSRKDFGQIGFHQTSFATYLIFPKCLPKDSKIRVIGVKYDLIQEQESFGAAQYKKTGAGTPQAKSHRKNIRGYFDTYSAVVEIQLSVTAEDKNAAKRLALEQIADEPFETTGAEITSVVGKIEQKGAAQD